MLIFCCCLESFPKVFLCRSEVLNLYFLNKKIRIETFHNGQPVNNKTWRDLDGEHCTGKKFMLCMNSYCTDSSLTKSS